MFTHIRVGSADVSRSRRFYDAALGALGIPPGRDTYGTLTYSDGTDRFAVATPREGEAMPGNGGTIGFEASSPEAVNGFHAAGLAHGGADEGAPGLRHGAYYAAYLRDPDGNKICALVLAPPPAG